MWAKRQIYLTQWFQIKCLSGSLKGGLPFPVPGYTGCNQFLIENWVRRRGSKTFTVGKLTDI